MSTPLWRTVMIAFLVFFSVLRHRVGEFHVEGLPNQGRQAHVEVGSLVTVDAAALVVSPIHGKGVQNLDLVVVHLIEATVAPVLAAIVGLVGEHEFQVYRVVVELTPGDKVALWHEGGELLVDHTPRPFALRCAVEENKGPGRRFLPESGALADRLAQAKELPAELAFHFFPMNFRRARLMIGAVERYQRGLTAAQA